MEFKKKFRILTIGLMVMVPSLALCGCGNRSYKIGNLMDEDFYEFLSDKDALNPEDGSLFIYEKAPRLIVGKVMGRGIFLVYEPEHTVRVANSISYKTGTRIVALYAPGRKYVDGDFIKNGIYKVDGTFSSGENTFRKYTELPDAQAKKIIAARDATVAELRAIKIRQEEERKAELERQRLKDLARLAEEERIREEVRLKNEAENARVKAESDKKIAEERRLAEIAKEKFQIEEAARKAEEARVEAERKRKHDEEMAKLNEEKYHIDQQRFSEYAEVVLSKMQLDPMEHFKIQASLRSLIGNISIKTVVWEKLAKAQKDKNWLEMISIMSKASCKDYPKPETVDGLIKEFFSNTFVFNFEKNPNDYKVKILRLWIHVDYYGISKLSYTKPYPEDAFIPANGPYIIAKADYWRPDVSTDNDANVLNLNKLQDLASVSALAEQLRIGAITNEDFKKKSLALAQKSLDDILLWLNNH